MGEFASTLVIKLLKYCCSFESPQLSDSDGNCEAADAAGEKENFCEVNEGLAKDAI